MSFEVNFNASAAVSLCSQLRQRIDEQDSGEITEYQVFSNINILSPTPIPKAPPEAPSPIITTIIGTEMDIISKMFRAMASPCPLSSASKPGKAPGVSIKVTIGIPNLSADFMSLNAFL